MQYVGTPRILPWKPSGNPVSACVNRSRVSRSEWKPCRFVGTGVFPLQRERGVGGRCVPVDTRSGPSIRTRAFHGCWLWYPVVARCRRSPEARCPAEWVGRGGAHGNGIRLRMSTGANESRRIHARACVYVTCQRWQARNRGEVGIRGSEEESGDVDARARSGGERDVACATSTCVSRMCTHTRAQQWRDTRETRDRKATFLSEWRRASPKSNLQL